MTKIDCDVNIDTAKVLKDSAEREHAGSISDALTQAIGFMAVFEIADGRTVRAIRSDITGQVLAAVDIHVFDTYGHVRSTPVDLSRGFYYIDDDGFMKNLLSDG